MKEIFLQPWEEAVGTAINYRVETDFIKLTMLSTQKRFTVMIPVSVVKDVKINPDELIGHKISILRTFYGIILKKEYNSSNNN